jgi:hypothetical protein
LIAIVVLALPLALAVAGCGDDVSSSTKEAAPAGTTSSGPTSGAVGDGRCPGHSFGSFAPTEALCPGRYTTGLGTDPFISLRLPEPSNPKLTWYGVYYSATDIQVRQGPSGCDGCEVGTFEAIIDDDAIATIRRLRNLEELHLRDTRVGERPVTEVRARLSEKAVAFGGIELGPGVVTGYLLTDGPSQVLVLMPLGDSHFARDAQKVLASLHTR